MDFNDPITVGTTKKKCFFLLFFPVSVYQTLKVCKRVQGTDGLRRIKRAVKPVRGDKHIAIDLKDFFFPSPFFYVF